MIAMAVAIVLILYLGFIIFYPVNLDTDGRMFEIKEGSGLSKIADILKEQQLIRSKYVFMLYVTALGEDRNLKAGKYYFSSRVTMNQIIYVLSRGLAEHDDVEVTIPEGMNVWEIDNILIKAKLIDEGDFAKIAIKYEGKLFPDTYRFKKEADVQDIIKKMASNFKGPNGNEVLIIASMLEKEAKTKEDMEIVAGIIQKRLGLKMPLQIDATVAYGACLKNISIYRDSEYKNCDVTQVNLVNEIKIDGPYNTYTRNGLPAGSISNPGLKALQAAVSPKETDYLYYLSTRDGSQIIYSKTASEHLKNRKKYLGF